MKVLTSRRNVGAVSMVLLICLTGCGGGSGSGSRGGEAGEGGACLLSASDASQLYGSELNVSDFFSDEKVCNYVDGDPDDFQATVAVQITIDEVGDGSECQLDSEQEMLSYAEPVDGGCQVVGRDGSGGTLYLDDRTVQLTIGGLSASVEADQVAATLTALANRS